MELIVSHVTFVWSVCICLLNILSPDYCNSGKVFRIGTVRYNWPMSAHASQAFSTAHCTDSEDLPIIVLVYQYLVIIRQPINNQIRRSALSDYIFSTWVLCIQVYALDATFTEIVLGNLVLGGGGWGVLCCNKEECFNCLRSYVPLSAFRNAIMDYILPACIMLPVCQLLIARQILACHTCVMMTFSSPSS